MLVFALVAMVAAFYFLIAALRRRRPADLLALVLWSAYAFYEWNVANGTLCDPNCNIRVDLLLFLPLLAVATFLALRATTSTGAVAALAVACLVLVGCLAALFGNTLLAATAGAGALIVGGWAVAAMTRKSG